MNLIYDLETDGLLDSVTTIWCIVAIDLATQEVYSYSDHDDELPSIAEGIELLKNATTLIGHNIVGYDTPVVQKVCGVDLTGVKHVDTLIMSRVCQYNRQGGHSLKAWGKALGNDKIEYDDWTGYSKEMLDYCVQDVMVNLEIYYAIMRQFKSLHATNPLISNGIRVEHEIAELNIQMKEQGWNFDMFKALETKARMEEFMAKTEREIEPLLGFREVLIDKEPKTPKFKKDGTYNANTCKVLSAYLGQTVNPEDTHLMAPGTEFQRKKQVQIELGQTALVKEWLLSIGWKPDDYTRKKINGKWVNQGPKLTTTSLEALGERGKLISEYYTVRNRLSVLNGWIENAQADGRLHGDMYTIGTPSFRCRHSGIVNIPSVEAAWGKEMRELFRADEGHVLVGADSSGNQLRGLVHYVDNAEYTDVVINGDQHQRNADALGCSRSNAKSFLYCYLFGGGDAKLGQCVTGKLDGKKGKKARDDFAASITGLQEIKDKVEGEWRMREHMQGVGWIHGLDGRPLFVPAEHQCLNYLLQCAEGITCKAAAVWSAKKFKELGLDATIRIFYHDEIQISCAPEIADQVAELAAASFREAPKEFGVMVMDGDAIIGNNYAETH